MFTEETTKGSEVATYIHFRLVKHNQAAGSLVEDAVKYLVEDHLTQSARELRAKNASGSVHKGGGRTKTL